MIGRDPDDARRDSRPLVRPATGDDLAAVLAVERAAFGGEEEAELVVQLLADRTAFVDGLSLVACEGRSVVGHVLFTRAACGDGTPAVLLAPLAVAPERQRLGVGTLLVHEGLASAAARGFDLAFVLGDPRYYSRFGFAPAYPHGVLPPYPVEPPEAWMGLELTPRTLAHASGDIQLADAFRDPALWRE